MTEICLTIADDGTMSVRTETPEPEDNQEQGTPVQSIDEALETIRQMAEQASMAPEAPETPATPAPAPAGDEEADAMMAAYKGR